MSSRKLFSFNIGGLEKCFIRVLHSSFLLNSQDVLLGKNVLEILRVDLGGVSFFSSLIISFPFFIV